MDLCTTCYEDGLTHIHSKLMETRSFKYFVIKPFLTQIRTLNDPNNFLETFHQIEKKAIHRYLLFLLSKQDRLSSDLLKKATGYGFKTSLVLEVIDIFKDKGYLDDATLLEKKALKKIKKGYCIKMTQGLKSITYEIKELEKQAMQKLFLKKRALFLSKEYKDKQKGYRFFLARGYSIDQINELIKSQGDIL